MGDAPAATNARPALRGGVFALLAAVLFGASTPLLQTFGAGTGFFWTAALLYAGAALVSIVTLRPAGVEARLARGDLPRLAAMAGLGATLGPVLLVWGLVRTSATSASLMLTLEAVFTAVFARMFYGEQMDRRVAAAMCLLTAGGAILVLDQGAGGGQSQALGLVAVAGATLAWGLDNTLSRALSSRDPAQVVLGKSLMGAGATAVLALAFGQAPPATGAALALAAIGVAGYGLSLRLYLLAQREIGAARTGSIYAFAPFVGAGIAFLANQRGMTMALAAGAALLLAGVLLHLTERHGHAHVHESMDHEHAHAHDDGHHTHVHADMPAGAHSHLHHHDRLAHDHPHVPDAHHTHRH